MKWFIFFILACQFGTAQKLIQITDSFENALPFASVYNKSQEIGAYADKDGKVILSRSYMPRDTIVTSHVGFINDIRTYGSVKDSIALFQNKVSLDIVEITTKTNKKVKRLIKKPSKRGVLFSRSLFKGSEAFVEISKPKNSKLNGLRSISFPLKKASGYRGRGYDDITAVVKVNLYQRSFDHNDEIKSKIVRLKGIFKKEEIDVELNTLFDENDEILIGIEVLDFLETDTGINKENYHITLELVKKEYKDLEVSSYYTPNRFNKSLIKDIKVPDRSNILRAKPSDYIYSRNIRFEAEMF